MTCTWVLEEGEYGTCKSLANSSFLLLEAMASNLLGLQPTCDGLHLMSSVYYLLHVPSALEEHVLDFLEDL